MTTISLIPYVCRTCNLKQSSMTFELPTLSIMSGYNGRHIMNMVYENTLPDNTDTSSLDLVSLINT